MTSTADARATVGETLTVRKILYDGQPSYTWSGQVVESYPDYLILAAVFERGPRDLGYVILEPGDLFVEFYYHHCWFNVFQIYTADGQLKGWYCNIGRPPQIESGELHYVDLALDLFVYPDGRELVLDEDEFEELRKTLYQPDDVTGALAGLTELRQWARDRRMPSRPFSIAPPR